MSKPRTVKGLIKAIKKFYETNGWGRHALYRKKGQREHWCIMGAAAAVLSNADYIRSQGNDNLGGWTGNMKGLTLLEEFREAWRKRFFHTPASSNDSAQSRQEILKMLDELEESL